MSSATLSVHVDTGREWRGGQAQVLHLVRGLGARGDRAVLVAPPNAPLAIRAGAAGCEVVELALRGEWDVASAARLYRLLRHLGADVVHAHTAHAVTLAGGAARAARTPLVVASRRVDFPVSRLGRRKLTHLVDVVVAVSHAIGAVLSRGGLAADRIAVIHSGVAAASVDAGDRARVRAELAPDGGSLIGAVGALVDHKDHACFIDAAAQLHRRRPDTRFVIVGAGPLADRLTAHIRALDLESVIALVGFRSDVAAVIAALDVFVLSSRQEGLGTSVLDAMAAGVPVAATAAGGVGEMITDSLDGLLVAPGDAAALATAIEKLVADRSLAVRLAAAARSRVAEQFSAESMIAATRELYRSRLRPADRAVR